LPALIAPRGLAGGDVKLAGLIGLTVGFPRVLPALTVGIVAGGLTIGLLLLTRRVGPKEYVPYGPFLVLGALVSLLR
jgi:leader peptidase (prepilin peptidase)/N-methyltransferase